MPIALEENCTCPHCGETFELAQALAQEAIERLQANFVAEGNAEVQAQVEAQEQGAAQAKEAAQQQLAATQAEFAQAQQAALPRKLQFRKMLFNNNSKLNSYKHRLSKKKPTPPPKAAQQRR